MENETQALFRLSPLDYTRLCLKMVLLQALIYPLTVASKSALQARHNAANKILKNMCEHSPVLVQQAVMVNSIT